MRWYAGVGSGWVWGGEQEEEEEEEVVIVVDGKGDALGGRDGGMHVILGVLFRTCGEEGECKMETELALPPLL